MISIVGVGARTHTGMTALQVAMSIRAGKLLPRESHMIDRAGEPISTCRLASISDNVVGVDRFLALAAPALVQSTHAWARIQSATMGAAPALPVILALPDSARPGFDPRVATRLLHALEERTSVAIDHRRSMTVAKCRAGGVMAIRAAIDRLAAGEDEAVLVGGVDSYFDPDALEALDAAMRLHSLQCENGFIPGEGAGFVLLSRRASSFHRFGQILSAEVELEPRPYGCAEPCHALGLTAAIKRAAEPVGPTARSIAWVLTDVANERHRVDEWYMAQQRMFRVFDPDVIHDQPLLKTGDVGAASAAILLVYACIAWQTGCARADRALLATHSDGAERGVVIAAREAS